MMDFIFSYHGFGVLIALQIGLILWVKPKRVWTWLFTCAPILAYLAVIALFAAIAAKM